MTTGSEGTGIRAMRIVTQECVADTERGRDIRCFPPLVQVLNLTLPHIQERLQEIARIGFRRGLGSDALCEELRSYANSMGYAATIGIQEVMSSDMPSFGGQTISTAVILIDLSQRDRFPDLLAKQGE